MIDFLGVLLLIVLIVLLSWLTRRAWRARRNWLKWPGTILSGLLAAIFTVALVLALIGFYRLNRTHDNPIPEISVEGTDEQIAFGERFAKACAGCHAEDGTLPLEGSNFAAGGPPLGTLYAPNLTPVHLGDWTDGEIVRAIRQGVGRDGRSLIIMPSGSFRNLADRDVASIVAYLRSQPAVEPDTPPRRLNVLGAIFTNLMPIFTRQEPLAGPVTAPPPGPTVDYGEYLISILACVDCHGENLTGIPDSGPNLTTRIPQWSEEQFITFFRTGTEPGGEQVGEGMPWQDYSNFATDDDLRAMYAYLSGLTPVQDETSE